MALLRKALLAASRSAWLRERSMRHRFMRRAVQRFMPGETAEAAIEAGRALESQGLATVFTLLGENVTQREEADAVAAHYLDVLQQLDGLDGEISVKATQLGLDLDPEFCFGQLDRLTAVAERLGKRTWIDMESSIYVDPTLELYRRLRSTHAQVGVCLQAYLYRTPADLESLLPLHPAIRLVKGAYLEPREIAHADKAEVDRSYLALAARLLDALVAADEDPADAVQVGFATHDRRIIERINAEAAERRLPRRAYEWQMLYGIQRAEQRRLANAGYAVRVLISYGDAWYPWYMRRLAERPANLLFVARNLLSR